MRKRFLKQAGAAVLYASVLLSGCGQNGQQASATTAEAETSAEAAGKYIPGTYTGEADGFGGVLKVEVTVDANAVTSITVTEQSETDGIGSKAIEALPDAIVKANSVEVDDISGATVSSGAIKAAVKAALAQAAGESGAAAELALTDGIYQAETTYDVVVVGGGLSGLTAACSAAGQGAKVALIEKQAFLGGTTMLAAGTIRYADEGDGAGMVHAILDEGADFREEGFLFLVK